MKPALPSSWEGLQTHSPHLGNGNVIAAAAGAQLSRAGIDRAVGRSEAAWAGWARGLHALQPGLQLPNLQQNVTFWFLRFYGFK